MICHSEGIFWKLELSRTDSSFDDSNPQLLYRATHPSVLDPGNRGVYLVIRSPSVQAIHSDSTRRPHAGPSPRIFIWSASGAERDRLAHATAYVSARGGSRVGEDTAFGPYGPVPSSEPPTLLLLSASPASPGRPRSRSQCLCIEALTAGIYSPHPKRPAAE